MTIFITIAIFLCISYILYCELKNLESIVLGSPGSDFMGIAASPNAIAMVDDWKPFYLLLGFIYRSIGSNKRILSFSTYMGGNNHDA